MAFDDELDFQETPVCPPPRRAFDDEFDFTEVKNECAPSPPFTPGPLPSQPPEDATRPSEDVLADWCQSPRLAALTGLVVNMLREMFKDDQNQVNDNLNRYVWLPTVQTPQGRVEQTQRGGIYIDSAGRFVAETAGLMPRLVVRRGNFDSKIVTLGNQMGYSELTGGTEYGKLRTGVVSVQALAKTEIAAETLVLEAERLLQTFADGIIRATKLMRFNPTGVGETKLVEADKTWSAAVPIEIEFMEEWSVVPQGPLLRTISLQLTDDE